MTERMTTQEIVKADCKRHHLNFEKIYPMLAQGVQLDKLRIMRHNNTLLVYSIPEQNVANVDLLTADSLPKFIDALRNLYQAMMVAGFKKAVASTTDPDLIRVLNKTGIKYAVETSQQGATTNYTITMEP
jgi:hypothetical protein